MTFDPTLFGDFARFFHLLSVAMGLGAAVMAETLVLSRLDVPLDERTADTLRRLHGVVWAALGAMWLTGICLIAVRTGLDPALVTPKLAAKLGVVLILTANAGLMGRLALPALDASIGLAPIDAPLGRRLAVALVAGVSGASWCLALMMGASRHLAASDWPVFVQWVPVIYLGWVTVALAAALALRPAWRLWHGPQVGRLA